MAYRFGIDSLPGPRFTASAIPGMGLFFVIPLARHNVDAKGSQVRIKSRKRGETLSLDLIPATGELARLLSGSESR